MAELKVGDTIKCKNGADMINTSISLAQEGIIVKVLKNYTLVIVNIIEGESEL